MKLAKDIPKHIEILIAGYITNDLDNKDLEILKKWLNRSTENKEHFEQVKASWYISEQPFSIGKDGVDEKWNNLKKRLELTKTKKIQDNRTTSILPLFTRIAAAIAFFLIGAGITYFVTQKNIVFKPAETEFIVPLGSKSMIKLPDGSSVWLNAGSRIKYNSGFMTDNVRQVELTGEGYFDVKTNPQRPFIVKANNLNITAHGTSFNVKAYPSDKKVVTTLVEGKVEIKGKGIDNKEFAINMKPKQKVTYYTNKKLTKQVKNKPKKEKETIVKTKESPSVEKINAPITRDTDVKTELYTSWKDKRWIIEQEEFSDLRIMLERRYNVSIEVDSPGLDSYWFSGTIENETIEQVFKIIRLTIPLSYTIKKGLVEVHIDNELKEKYESAYK